MSPRSPRPKPPPLQARAILEVLERHGVAYVVIGGIGARLWGSPALTDDLDICAGETPENAERLAAALNELGARFRPAGLEEGFDAPAPWDRWSFDSFTSVTLTTEFGWLDVWLRPDGTRGYSDLAERASRFGIDDLVISVASLEDIIRSKEASGRDKDLTQLPLLHELRRQLKPE